MLRRLGHFGPTDRNDQTGHSGPPSKLVPNIPVGPNRNGPFHLMYQPKLPEFWVEWKAPEENKIKLLRRKHNGIIRFEVTDTTEQANANPESPTVY